MMREIDTSAEAVEGYAHNLEVRGFAAEAATLRALAAERDALRRHMQVAATEQWHAGYAAATADRDRLAPEPGHGE